jgi:tetratricopeptide (TPR) repeat protein
VGLPGALILLGICLVLGTLAFLEHARQKAFLDGLPQVPDLSITTEAFRKRLAEANDDIAKTFKADGLSQQLGLKVGELGRVYQANHYYDQAVPCYQLAGKLDPQNPHWPYLLASVHQERGATKSVVPLLARAIDLAPTYSPAVLKLADSHFKSRKISLAQSYYARRLNLLPGDPYALLGLARIAIDESQWKTAQKYLEETIASHPEFGAAQRLLATVHSHFGRSKEAQEALDRAEACIRFRPAPDPWVDGLSDLCLDFEQLLVLGSKALTDLDVDKALKLFTKAKDLDPNNPKAYLALGRLWFMAGKKDQARVNFIKAIDLDPKSDEAYFQLGLILRSDGNLEEAESMFLKALDFHPNNPNVYNNLGVTLLEQQEFLHAIKYLEKALEIYPEHINARFNLAMSLWGSGKTREAIEQYNLILAIKPNLDNAANALAWILATDKDNEIRNGREAVRWATVACSGKGQDNPEYLDTLAAAYAEAGQFGLAVQTAQRSIDLSRLAKDEDLAKEVSQRLELYRSKKAYRK